MFKGASYLLEILSKVDIKGRKKLQKIIFLLENNGMDAPYKYSYHYYGPYSAQLQDEVDFLVEQEFLEEISQGGTYIYKITDYGTKFKKHIEDNYKVSIDKDLLIKLNNENPQFLEILSTYVFLLKSGYDEGSSKEKAKELKPHLRGFLDDAVKFYEFNLI